MRQVDRRRLEHLSWSTDNDVWNVEREPDVWVRADRVTRVANDFGKIAIDVEDSGNVTRRYYRPGTVAEFLALVEAPPVVDRARVLNLQPGDVLVVETDDHLSPHWNEHLSIPLRRVTGQAQALMVRRIPHRPAF